MPSQPDWKPNPRTIASRDDWERIVAAKQGPCRSCGSAGPIEFHHLIPKGNTRGDDVEANLVPLCRACHHSITDRLRGWEEIAAAVRHSLTPLERQYAIAKVGKWKFDRLYPHSDDGLCSKCRKPRASKPPSDEPRQRKRWVVTVPDDAENGAQILDELVEQARQRLLEKGLSVTSDTPAYFVLVAALVDWLQS